MRDEGNIFVSVSRKMGRRERNRTRSRVEFFEIVRLGQGMGKKKKQERQCDAPQEQVNQQSSSWTSYLSMICFTLSGGCLSVNR
jgi:hypothetical protein